MTDKENGKGLGLIRKDILLREVVAYRARIWCQFPLCSRASSSKLFSDQNRFFRDKNLSEKELHSFTFKKHLL